MYYPAVARLLLLSCFVSFSCSLLGQHSIAREWNEAVLQTIREDLARSPVQARNLFHFSVALYDSWAAYDKEADTYLLGKTAGGFTCPCKKVPVPEDIEAAREEAMSFAAYRLLTARYSLSPSGNGALVRFQDIMKKHGYNFRDYSFDYESGSPAALGNYLAQCILQMGQQDAANEQNNYRSKSYHAINLPLVIDGPGVPTLQDPNSWQPLKLTVPIDQDGHRMLECKCGGKPLIDYDGSVDPGGRPVTTIQAFPCPDWGHVPPFALSKQDRKIYQRDNQEYWVYHDPGADQLPRLDVGNGSDATNDYAWNFALVAAWSAILDTDDNVLWDVSPGSTGNVLEYPKSLPELRDFYKTETGRDAGAGYTTNPRTGQPYTPQIVPRGDFTRVAAAFWDEGPDKETAAGHWFAMLNYVSDQPGLVKKFNGKGRIMNDLEWDVKSYFALAGALHDAAVSTWSIKRWYNSIRPISAVRYLASLGQSSNHKAPAYNPSGIPLIPGRIELVKKGDPLAGDHKENVGKIKFYAWKGPFSETDSTSQTADVGWILGENWFPYQSEEFITPPYAGFISEHSAFSHAAAAVLTQITGDEYFPGGLGEFTVRADSNFLNLGKGPGIDLTLQWATYRDAADQASLSRIWAGTNPPFDDMPGRLIGDKVGADAFRFAKNYFYKDRDHDGYFSYEDCDDNNPKIHPGAPELCDKLDNDCNGKIDDNAPCSERQ
ncbi:MAG: hypothetical protein H6574_04510 [Lewinellaceae bacterium]|nr:hypothetical protein [Saprospiraceae bacterium]MCB9330324.1 hypothetical protein [Lewinellaceae bacterium]